MIVRSGMDANALWAEHNECIATAKELIDFCRGQPAPDSLGWIIRPDPKGWAAGVREWRGLLDQKNKMLGIYDNVDPKLQKAFARKVIEVVTHALKEYPEAQQKVLEAIDRVEESG